MFDLFHCAFIQGQGQSFISLQYLHLIQSIQKSQRLCSVQSSLTLRTRIVQETTVCTGSEPDQVNLIPVYFMPMEKMGMYARRVLKLSCRTVVSTTFLKASVSLMGMGLITVLWPHVDRCFLDMEQNWTLKVSVNHLDFVELISFRVAFVHISLEICENPFK